MQNSNPYTLQPGLQRVQDRAVPEYRADQHVFVYPQPANLNYCCRPNTVIYGTAPYMAGKGAPHELIEVDDMLRPQSTSEFNKYYSSKPYDFPNKNVECMLPQRTRGYDPESTRGEIQNGLFLQRYCKK